MLQNFKQNEKKNLSCVLYQNSGNDWIYVFYNRPKPNVCLFVQPREREPNIQHEKILQQITKADCWKMSDANFPKYEMKVLDGTV